jgi:serine/threonine protein kinase
MAGEQGVERVERTVMGPGSVFHNWELKHEIARGGMGVVYFAKHRMVGRPAAVKVIAPPPGTVAEPKAIDRFHREVELHVSLRLPNLPEFYDAELFPDGTAVLVLEFLDGKDLASALRTLGRIPVGDALFVVTELLRPLQVIHTTSVHRDVKPPNIFLRRRPRYDSEGRIDKNRVTLLDFGIAKMKLKPGVTREHTLVGTKCYMSPEQLRGESLDGRSDLYSVAIVLYEMLFGHPPFIPDRDRVPNFNVVMVEHLARPFPDLRGAVSFPDDVWAFIQSLSQKSPADRPASAEAALATARELRTKYRDTARLFREDIQDVVAAMERLAAERVEVTLPPVTNPMATDRTVDPAFLSTEEDVRSPSAHESQLSAWPEVLSPGARDAASNTQTPSASASLASAPLEHASPAPAALAFATVPDARSAEPAESSRDRRAALPSPGKPTARLSESDETTAWEDELATRLQKKLRAPRVFRRPALVELSEDLLPVAVHELRKPASWLGSHAGADVSLRDAAIAPEHVCFKLSKERRLGLELARGALHLPDAMVLDGRREVIDEATHGSFLRCVDRTFRVEDLVAADPTGELQRVRKRKRPATLRGFWAAGGGLSDGLGAVLVGEAPVTHTLTLVGSANACQLQLDDGPGFAAAIWLRADGELEATLLDESKLPFGDPVVRAWLLSHGDRVRLFGDYVLEVDDAPELSSLQRGVGSPLSPRAPQVRAREAAVVRPTPRGAPPSPGAPPIPRAPPTASAPLPTPSGSRASSTPARQNQPPSGASASPTHEAAVGQLVVVLSHDPSKPFTVPLPDAGPFPIGSARSRGLVLPHIAPQHLVVEQLPGGRLRVRAASGATFDLHGQLVDAADVPDGGSFRLPRIATFTFRAKRAPTPPGGQPTDDPPEVPLSGLQRLLKKVGL